MCSIVGNERRCIPDMIEHPMIEHLLEIIYLQYIYYHSRVDRIYVST